MQTHTSFRVIFLSWGEKAYLSSFPRIAKHQTNRTPVALISEAVALTMQKEYIGDLERGSQKNTKSVRIFQLGKPVPILQF